MVDVLGQIISKVAASEGTVISLRLVEHRDMWRDGLLLDQPVQHRSSAISDISDYPLSALRVVDASLRPRCLRRVASRFYLAGGHTGLLQARNITIQKTRVLAKEELLLCGIGAVARLALKQPGSSLPCLCRLSQETQGRRQRSECLIIHIPLPDCSAGELCRDVVLSQGEMRQGANVVETPEITVPRAEDRCSIEQDFCFDLTAMPEQVEALSKMRLREARVELQGQIDRRERFIVLMRKA
ncbi:hypothetical protein XH98_06440 [Bradyrhizobium sp. CCBAU 51745]|nr:hypothetical protein [Bradyrhizobium sp. CCBAU 45384]MDA9438766.1 hypothetical protein [Bradyrhizobium sp. CCBAU 51745]